MLISTAYAQGAGGGGAEALIQFAPLILIFVVFYFLLIRPQQRKQKEHKAMLQNLRRGDKIVTMGGLVATITKVINEKELTVEIAEGTRVRLMRDFVGSVVSKTEPADSGSGSKDDEKSGEDNKEDKK